jgi:hypothetical protein
MPRQEARPKDEVGIPDLFVEWQSQLQSLWSIVKHLFLSLLILEHSQSPASPSKNIIWRPGLQEEK